jgi:transcriptional regulator with XRE-family HTH domain
MLGADMVVAATGTAADTSAPARSWTGSVGRQLRQRRMQAGLSRAAVAAAIGVAEESVRRWEKGGSRPSDAAVAAYLGAVGGGVLDDADAGNRDNSNDDDGDGRRRHLADLLRRRRDELGISQAKAALSIGVAQATYAGWEICRATPGRELAPPLARFLGQPAAEVARLLEVPLELEMTTWPLLGRIIGERRMALQLDRRELALRANVSPRTVAAWELGEKRPRDRHIRRLAEVLDVQPAVLTAALPERTPPTELGRLIRSQQRALGLTRDEIAYAAGVDAATVSRWTWGRHAPSEQNLRGLARALQLDERLVRQAAPL